MRGALAVWMVAAAGCSETVHGLEPAPVDTGDALATAPVDTGEGDDEVAVCAPFGVAIDVTGGVVDETGAALAGAEVALDVIVTDSGRPWTAADATTLGQGASATDGVFAFVAADVPIGPGCAPATAFVLRASAGDRYGERDVGDDITAAWTGGTFTVDLTGAPLVAD